MMPLTDSPADRAKAKHDDAHGRRWYTDPLFKGEYPPEVVADLGADAPVVMAGDMEAIAEPLDYLGVNYYSRALASAAGPIEAKDKPYPKTDMGWEIYPDGLRELLLTLHREYALPPTYITENGGAFPDAAAAGRVHDADRIDYLAAHIQAVGQALAAGVPMVGYMVWSLMDNFEWSSGYAKRFGIVHVDYDTLERTPKDSALWYRDLVAQCRALRKAGV
jgi:beta-glucosidase